jgi:hypothetical protein
MLASVWMVASIQASMGNGCCGVVQELGTGRIDAEHLLGVVLLAVALKQGLTSVLNLNRSGKPSWPVLK